MTDLVAPARYLYRGTAHRRGPDQPIPQRSDGDTVNGWTACGLPLLTSELWRPVPAEDVAKVCPRCEQPDRQHEEATLL